MQNALAVGYMFLCRRIYIKLLEKLTVDQILIIYQMFHDIRILNEDSIFLKQYITQNTITEFLNRQISLKTIVNYLMLYIALTNDSNDLLNILICAERHIKSGEYWNTVRPLVLKLPQHYSEYKHIIQKILIECIQNKKITDIKDVNNNLINKLSPALISILDNDIMKEFKNLLTEKTENDSRPAILIQNFGDNPSNTIASPDGNTNLSQTEFSECNNTLNLNKSSNGNNDTTEVNGENYTLHPIGNFIVRACANAYFL